MTPKEHTVSPFIKDWGERIVRTFLAAALAIVTTNLASVTNLDAAKTLGAAAMTAGVTAVIGLLGRLVGDPNTASVIKTPEA
jgi:CheY-specific phosphatase CheX